MPCIILLQFLLIANLELAVPESRYRYEFKDNKLSVPKPRTRSRQRLTINVCSTRDLTACCNSKSQRNLFLNSRSTASTAASLSTNVRNLGEQDAIFHGLISHWPKPIESYFP